MRDRPPVHKGTAESVPSFLSLHEHHTDDERMLDVMYFGEPNISGPHISSLWKAGVCYPSALACGRRRSRIQLPPPTEYHASSMLRLPLSVGSLGVVKDNSFKAFIGTVTILVE